jgi:hypothetical protein
MALSTPQTSTYHQDMYQHEEWRDIVAINALPHRLYGTKPSKIYHEVYWQTFCASILPSLSKLHDPRQLVRTSDNTQRSWHNAWWDWISNFDADSDRKDTVSSECARSEIAFFNACVGVSTMLRKLFVSEDEK